MDLKDTNFHIQATDEKPVVIHVYEGKAPVHHDPLTPAIQGDIHSAANFIAVNEAKETVKKDRAIVIFNHNDGVITLQVDPTSKFGANISGKLQKNRDLAELDINGKEEMAFRDLREILRFAKPLFSEAASHAKIMEDLKEINISVSKEFTDHRDDSTGNSNLGRQVTTNIKNGMVKEFFLTTPIFEGEMAKKFKVEVCFNADGGQLTCWLESVELKELEKSEMDRIMLEEKKNFDGYVCIDQR